jgi:UDP-glucose 4-epimerase
MTLMKGDRPTVLVTGASGFVGRHLAPTLTREGWTVRRAVRQLSGNPEEARIQTIGPGTDWEAALAGADAVVHLAARVHHQSEKFAYKLYQDVNVEGTLHLARCAVKAGVRQFVFLSTVLVYGRSNDGRAPFSEEDILTPRGLYAMSKAKAEDGLRSLAESHEMSITVVRPPLVYGSGAKGNFVSLVRAVKLGIPLPFAAIHNQRAFVSVQNLASFVASRLAKPAGKFDVFLVADDEQVSTPEFIRRLASAAGRRALLFPVPAPLLSALLAISGRPEARQSLIGSLQLDVSKAASTGWRPPLTLDEGLRLALSEPDE